MFKVCVKFSGGLRNIPGGWELLSGFDKFSGWLHVKFSGSVKTFSRRVENILVGRGLRFFEEELRIFHKGLEFFEKGLRFSSSVWDCFSDGYGEGSFSGRLRFFREGFQLFGGVEMLSEVFGIFSGGVGIISVVLSLFRGFERFLGGGGEIFSGWLISIFMCMGRLKLSKGG